MKNIGNLDQKFVDAKLSHIDSGVKFSVPIDIGVTTVAINEDKVKAALGKD